MNFVTFLLAICGAMLVAAYVLWDLGADRALASFGRLVIRAITFGRVRIASNEDESTAMAVSAATLQVHLGTIRTALASWQRWNNAGVE